VPTVYHALTFGDGGFQMPANSLLTIGYLVSAFFGGLCRFGLDAFG
jgi:hypothetical protein